MLFIPANKTRWAASGIEAGADALVFDLEDAVAHADKEDARKELAAYLHGRDLPALPLFVRVNDLSTDRCLRDLEAVVSKALTGVMLPKVSSRDDVMILDRLLTWVERSRDLYSGRTLILPVLETAKGIRSALSIAESSRRVAYVGGLAVKGGDVERAVGYRWSADAVESLAMRSNVLLDARAAGIDNPLTGLWSDVRDLQGLRAFAANSRDLGYEGMLAIHPSHIPVINDVFTPSAEELARDAALVTAMEKAALERSGATVFEGEMVDEAMAETARVRLAKYARSRPTGSGPSSAGAGRNVL
jgi:citrate lyase subunit beta/citryl-CoA lyase